MVSFHEAASNKACHPVSFEANNADDEIRDADFVCSEVHLPANSFVSEVEDVVNEENFPYMGKNFVSRASFPVIVEVNVIVSIAAKATLDDDVVLVKNEDVPNQAVIMAIEVVA